ncbi:MAG TPA: methylglyoxal synthase [Alphaproteobacteria bacterium]|nr:methylglyoxal synthase [Alphaproteobacteria bacterium]
MKAARRRGAPRTLALVAHDQMKDRLTDWAIRHQRDLAGYRLVATGTTGRRIAQACAALKIRRLKSGPLGGDQQIGALIAEGKVDGLIFFIDPLTAMPHDVDVKALIRLSILYDVPFACNDATANLMMRGLKSRPKA